MDQTNRKRKFEYDSRSDTNEKPSDNTAKNAKGSTILIVKPNDYVTKKSSMNTSYKIISLTETNNRSLNTKYMSSFNNDSITSISDPKKTRCVFEFDKPQFLNYLVETPSKNDNSVEMPIYENKCLENAKLHNKMSKSSTKTKERPKPYTVTKNDYKKTTNLDLNCEFEYELNQPSTSTKSISIRKTSKMNSNKLNEPKQFRYVHDLKDTLVLCKSQPNITELRSINNFDTKNHSNTLLNFRTSNDEIIHHDLNSSKNYRLGPDINEPSTSKNYSQIEKIPLKNIILKNIVQSNKCGKMKYEHKLKSNLISSAELKFPEIQLINNAISTDHNYCKTSFDFQPPSGQIVHRNLHSNKSLIPSEFSILTNTVHIRKQNVNSTSDNHNEIRSQESFNRYNIDDMNLNGGQQIISPAVPIAQLQSDMILEMNRNVSNLPQLQQSNIIRTRLIYNEVEIDYLGPMNIQCTHCKALHFRDEMVAGKGKSFNTCCNHGKVELDEITYPDYLLNLFKQNDADSTHFLHNIRRYNSNFAFASLNTNVVNFNNNRPGPFCFKILRDVYYKINTALHANENMTPTNGQVFIYDGEEAVNYRKERDNTLQNNILRNLHDMFKTQNVHAQSYLMMKEEIDLQNEIMSTNGNDDTIPELRMVFTMRDNLDPNRYNVQRSNEVAAIFTTTADGEIPESWVVVRNSRDRQLKNIPLSNENVDAWLYPIFFPLGTGTWNAKIPKINIEKNAREKFVTRNKWLKYMIAYREESPNIFLRGCRLFQQFLVTSYVNVQKDVLNWYRYNQKTLKVDSYTALKKYIEQKAVNQNKRVGKIVVLPSTFVGSPRYMQQLYQDAMAEVRNSGVPHLFITQTCNPHWKEIRENLFEGQQPSDRPDLIARVFHLKKKRLLKNIIEKEYFGRVISFIWVIEFQKRGLPHMHLLVTLAKQNKLDTPEKIDYYISAEIPDPITQPRLHELVTKHMIHGPCGNRCQKDGRCTKGFPKNFQNETVIDENNYPAYKRINNGKTYEKNGFVFDNRNVVPFVAAFLLEFDCHINVEIVGSTYCVKYLYKYILKGHDAAAMTIENADTVEHDEIKTFLDSRYLSSIEAVERILEIPLHGNMNTVIKLPIHLENQQMIFMENHENGEPNLENALNQTTMLLEFFNLNKRDDFARNILYSDIPKHFTYDSKLKKWKRRQRNFNVIERMYFTSPSQKELFHMRLLLLKVPGPTSFEHLRTVNGIIHKSYVDACIALGLVESDDEWVNALTEAAQWMMPRPLRLLFTQIILHCNPAEPIKIWDKFKLKFSEDYNRTLHDNAESIKKSYQFIKNILNRENKSDLFDIPDLNVINDVDHNIELQEQRFIESSEECLRKGNDLYLKLTDEQKTIVDAIMKALLDNDENNNCFFIKGFGGSGKTYVYNTIYYLARGNGKKVCTTAFTGIAATLLPQGQTLHKTFGLPVPIYSDSNSSITAESTEAAKLLSYDLFLIDEAPAAIRYIYEIMDRLLRYVTGKEDKTFGGKIVAAGGDFRQTLPIQKHANKNEIIDLSMKNSPLWCKFQQYNLTQNMRTLPSETNFSNFLLQLGDGELNDDDDSIDLSHIPEECLSYDLDSIVKDTFENIIIDKNYREIKDIAILACRNDDVNELNERAVKLLDPMTERVYTSVDTLDSNCDNGFLEESISPEHLHQLSPNSLPPHELILRKYSVIMLIRNLDVDQGLCNGTRLLILDMTNNALMCEILTGDKAGHIVFLCRIIFYCDKEYAFTFKRLQFPIKLAFAMTINKSQGQTMRRIALFLKNQVFSHGQLYVALSRVRSWNSLKIYFADRSMRRIKNFVFTELYD